jgi:hypothetical protein
MEICSELFLKLLDVAKEVITEDRREIFSWKTFHLVPKFFWRAETLIAMVLVAPQPTAF